METTQLAKQEQNGVAEINKVPEGSAFSMQSFDHAQRVAKMLSSSSLIPKDYQGNIQNTMIALEMANRIGASPLMVMQNLYIVHGKPSWSSTFIISAINSCKKFSPLRFDVTGEGETLSCVAWAYELSTNEKLQGPAVTMKMAKAEGWIEKNGSKWKTMPELMIRYRSAAFFGRLYAPEILMGMQTTEEVIDVIHEEQTVKQVNKEHERIKLLISDCTNVDELERLSVVAAPDPDLVEFYNAKWEQLSKTVSQ
jgi:hypothetical protein